MFEKKDDIYSIGLVAKLINEHPETLRVWEKNNLIKPDRSSYQRKYSNEDIKRLKFIKYLLLEKKLNIAGVKQVIEMYSCWYVDNCEGGAKGNAKEKINRHKPCWKRENTFCLVLKDKSEWCNGCNIKKKCSNCGQSENC
ncbi:MerR family transcriptional regulator [Helicovermis profundi]|uniref:MerR family transcriptional regulator n=1 Tax=Helicovermis profundi TaxID=3065157 RepID=A0AAU9E5S3_9FIRM|nr:MerR family transcriptional regulator [Clostridia bacterium S502]